MADGFERVSGTPAKTFKSDFVLNNTTSQQHKLGGTLGTVTMEVTNISSLGTRGLSFYDAANNRYQAECDSSVTYLNSTYNVIGTSGVSTVALLARAIYGSISDAIDTQGLQVSVSYPGGSEFTVTRSNINNGVVSIASDEFEGELVDEENIQLPVGETNSLLGTIRTQQAPFSIGIKGPMNLRGRTTAYKVTK